MFVSIEHTVIHTMMVMALLHSDVLKQRRQETANGVNSRKSKRKKSGDLLMGDNRTAAVVSDDGNVTGDVDHSNSSQFDQLYSCSSSSEDDDEEEEEEDR